jgi:hypothetical protein
VVTAHLFPVNMKILVGGVALRDVVCQVRRGFPVNSLYSLCKFICLSSWSAAACKRRIPLARINK